MGGRGAEKGETMHRGLSSTPWHASPSNSCGAAAKKSRAWQSESATRTAGVAPPSAPSLWSHDLSEVVGQPGGPGDDHRRGDDLDWPDATTLNSQKFALSSTAHCSCHVCGYLVLYR